MVRVATAAVLNLLLGVSGAFAQSFPTRPVSVIVPSSPAGITDIAARFLGERLSDLWGKQVVVENRPGGGGSIGVSSAVRAAPDGYTLLMTTNGELALNPAITTKTKYDHKKDLVPIAMITNNPIVVAANTASPYKTLADVVAAAKASPGNIGWASPGTGTWNHITGEWLADALGIKLLHVPYRGGGPAGTALAGGEIPLGFIAISSALPHVQSGRVRVLALINEHRSKVDMSWPTVSETAVPGFDSKQWVGLYAPAGIDPALRDRIEADVLSVLSQPAVRSRFETAGVEVIGLRGAEASKQLEIDSKVATEVARKASIQVD